MLELFFFGFISVDFRRVNGEYYFGVWDLPDLMVVGKLVMILLICQ